MLCNVRYAMVGHAAFCHEILISCFNSAAQCAPSCHVTLCCVMLIYVMSCYATPCFVMLRYVMLYCYVTLWCVILLCHVCCGRLGFAIICFGTCHVMSGYVMLGYGLSSLVMLCCVHFVSSLRANLNIESPDLHSFDPTRVCLTSQRRAAQYEQMLGGCRPPRGHHSWWTHSPHFLQFYDSHQTIIFDSALSSWRLD